MEQSGTTASLRGIHAAGPGVAWASGTNGTVLRTEDAGFVWQRCAMPPGAEKLDFRGVWAWDAMTAIVMSSGPGDQSRLYKTMDGCVNWKLLLTNPDKDGFWDAIAFSDEKNGYLLGDPVGGSIVLLRTDDGGVHWMPIASPGLAVADASIGFFAASNTSLIVTVPVVGAVGLPWMGTGSAKAADGAWQGPFFLHGEFDCTPLIAQTRPKLCLDKLRYTRTSAHLAAGSDASGIFSLGLRHGTSNGNTIVAVGGNYKEPAQTTGTAAWSADDGQHWTAATHPPHGYRSAVAWDEPDKAWITAGPNGTDISRDDGKTWLPLENGNWNAISLPYLVGPGGHIGKLVSLPEAGLKAGAHTGQTTPASKLAPRPDKLKR